MNPDNGDFAQRQAPSAAERRDAWSRYWSHGAAHSCLGTYGDLYGGAIGEFWGEVFGALVPGSRVLDVATGNGALPRLLLAQRRHAGVSCDAVDIAQVRPDWLASLEADAQGRIRFHGGTDAARMPFPDGSFDLIVSQYGFEYTRREGALAEILRVRHPEGRIAMVLHHAMGRPASLAAVEIGHLRWLLAGGGLFDAAQALVEPMARAATPEGRSALQRDAQANAARERFNAVQGELSARAEGDGADVLREARDAVASLFVLAGRSGAATAEAALLALREEYSASQTRLQDLCEHALGEDEALALRESIAVATGRAVRMGELRESKGYLMGWTLRA